MFISNYNLINTTTYMYSSLCCFSHPTNHQHVAVKWLYVHKPAPRENIISGVSYPIRTHPACSVTKARFNLNNAHSKFSYFKRFLRLNNKCPDQTAWMLRSVYLIESVPLWFACNKTRFYDFDGTSAICNDKFAMC